MPTKISPRSVSRRPQSPVVSDQPKSDPNLARQCIVEGSSVGRAEDPACPDAGRKRISRRASANLARHARKCTICNHPDREFIEEDFIAWRSEIFICRVYTLPSPSSIYRHASATGLLARRRRNLRGVAERIMENVNGATVTASAVLRAMRLFASITEDGQWAEPPKRSIVTHIHTHAASPTSSLDPAPPASPSDNNPPNCHSERVPTPVGTTRLARRGGNLHFDKPGPRIASDTQPPRDNTHSAPSASPSDSPVAAGLSGDSETPAATPSVTDHPAGQQQDRKTRLRLDYLPRWAAGLRDAEILIGVENSSPGESTD